MLKWVTQKVLVNLDKCIFDFLKNNKDIMPLRFTKLIANYYSDARIRKIYWEKLGIIMGENTYANLGLTLGGDGSNNPSVFIGNNVTIAPNLTVISDSCPINSNFLQETKYIKSKLIKGMPIVIEDDVWIGTNVTILPGVTIRKGSVIGAGSVVLKDTEPYSTYAGVPAKLLHNIEDKAL